MPPGKKSIDIIVYFSKRLSKSQCYHSPTVEQGLAVVWSFIHRRPLLMRPPFRLPYRPPGTHSFVPYAGYSNILTRQAIALQNYDFPVKCILGKLYIVLDTVIYLFRNVTAEEIPSKPRLAAIRRNVPETQQFQSPAPPDLWSVRLLHTLVEIAPVESDCELFTNAVYVFPVVNPIQLLDLQKQDKSIF